jgi:ribosome-associated protein
MDEASLPNLDNLAQRERIIPVSAAELEGIHEMALVAARAAASVKAEDVKVLDMHELVTYTDYLVICTGRNARLTKRIAEEVAFRTKEQFKLIPKSVEGAASGDWILVDFIDFMLHVFTPEARDFYRLDVLWKQAPAEEIE